VSHLGQARKGREAEPELPSNPETESAGAGIENSQKVVRSRSSQRGMVVRRLDAEKGRGW